VPHKVETGATRSGGKAATDETKGMFMTEYTSIRITQDTRRKLGDIVALIKARAAAAHMPVEVSLSRLIDELADDRLAEETRRKESDPS